MMISKVGKLAHYPAWSFATVSEGLRRQAYRSSTFQSFRRHFQIPPAPIERPLFIIGTVQSGKTTLATCLGKHPRIMYVGYELTTEWCDLANIKIARSHNNIGDCPPYTEAKATKACCDSVRNGFAEILSRNGGGRRTQLIDDNPHLWNKLSFLRKIFLDATLIIMSRDIRSTVASTKLLWIKGNQTRGKKYYIPENREYCWGVIPPVFPEAIEARRIFPGGEVAVLADYWLRTYEMIEKTIENFGTPILIKHREFLADPDGTLAALYETLDLPALRCPLPELDTSWNHRWREILTSQEQQQLEAFIDSNRSAIKRLRYADTML